MTILDGFVSQAELAKQLDKTRRTLQRWERLREGPPVVYIGRDPYYSVESVRTWIRSRERQPVRRRGRAA
jgi:biotin operon repressor